MKQYRVTVSGLSGNKNEGKMARLLANRLDSADLRSKFQLVAESMTGPNVTDTWFVTPSCAKIALYKGVVSNVFFESAPNDERGPLLALETTIPTAVNENVERYCECLIPFVSLTTGGNREALVKTVERSQISAVIDTNMSVPIVILMSMLRWAARTYPKFPLLDYDLTTDESHQAGKKDKSGTAIAIGKIFKLMGVRHTEEVDINAIRDLPRQRAMGIPEEALGGHAYHSYALTPPGGGLVLKFIHNIIGRQTYVDGTMMALEFLAQKVEEGVKGKVFTMEDVLKG